MILLHDPPSAGTEGGILVVFGAGLIGSHIVASVSRSSCCRQTTLPLSWSSHDLYQHQLRVLGDTLAELGTGSRRSGRGLKVTFLWSAGRIGFAATESEANHELDSFRSVLELVRRTAERFPGGRVAFLLVSSLGGLFEGQRRIDRLCLPCPKRPYGWLKFEQEKLVSGLGRGCGTVVFRLSSVYGLARPDSRRGLISTLLINGIREEVSVINGRPSTLRDFVWVEDVAEYIARVIRRAEVPAPSTRVLASGRPMSVFEAKSIVEETLGRAVRTRFQLDPDNQEHITVAQEALPTDWNPSNHKTSTRQMFRFLLERGIGSWLA